MLLQVVLHESSPLNKNRLYRLRALCDPVMIKIELIGLVVYCGYCFLFAMLCASANMLVKEQKVVVAFISCILPFLQHND